MNMFSSWLPRPNRQWVDHIPVRWVLPEQRNGASLAIWIPCFGGRKEDVERELRQLATDGFIAVSFDPWQHGERRSEATAALQARVFGNFQRHMWPILAHSTEDCLRVMDWALEQLGASTPVVIGGLSMGGDIAVAASGLDSRIAAVAAMLATPDWSRPGMDLSPGWPDRYARYHFERLNPAMHLDRYAHCPSITFECGGQDAHVPPAGALAFREALAQCYVAHPERLRVVLHRGIGHQGTDAMWQNCRIWFQEYHSGGSGPVAS